MAEIKTLIYEEMNTDIAIIHGEMSSQLEVVDVVVNKPVKDNLWL